ncbi:hypothetical protein ACOZGD_20410 [Streptomyces murinus]
MARKTTIIVTGDHNGDIGGTIIKGSTGPVALNGDIHIGDTVRDNDDREERTFGPGVTVVEGDHHGGISHRY